MRKIDFLTGIITTIAGHGASGFAGDGGLAQPNLIAGPDSLCAGAEGLFIISSVPDADTYNWLLPQGWSVSSVSDSISVFPGTSSGTISVSASNVCGSSPAQTLQITVTSFDTSISDLVFFISSNDSNSSYQWIDCASNSIIQGATGQDFFPTQNGNYAVVLSQNTCLDTSSCFSYVNTSLLSISNMNK